MVTFHFFSQFNWLPFYTYQRLKALFTPGVRPSFSDFHVHPNSIRKLEAKKAVEKDTDPIESVHRQESDKVNTGGTVEAVSDQWKLTSFYGPLADQISSSTVKILSLYGA